MSLGERWTLTVKAWRLILEPWRAHRPVVEDTQHLEFEEKLYPDPEQQKSRKLDPDSDRDQQ